LPNVRRIFPLAGTERVPQLIELAKNEANPSVQSVHYLHSLIPGYKPIPMANSDTKLRFTNAEDK
jgi:hypothetical protein